MPEVNKVLQERKALYHVGDRIRLTRERFKSVKEDYPNLKLNKWIIYKSGFESLKEDCRILYEIVNWDVCEGNIDGHSHFAVACMAEESEITELVVENVSVPPKTIRVPLAQTQIELLINWLAETISKVGKADLMEANALWTVRNDLVRAINRKQEEAQNG